MQTLMLGTATICPSEPVGTATSYSLALLAQGQYVFQQAGPGQCQIDVYGPFPLGEPLVPNTGNGRLKVCGLGKWGMREFTPGTYLVVTTQKTAGQFSILARETLWPQSWLDAFLCATFNKSEC